MKSVSVLVEFLIYTFIAIFSIGIILFYVHLSSNNIESKSSIRYIENSLYDLNNNINNIYSCYSCSTRFYIQLPNPSDLYLYNNSNIISVIYLSYVNCSLYLNNNELIYAKTKKFGNNYLCNISLSTFKYYTNQKNISEYDEICLIINKTVNNLYLEKC